MEIEFSRKYYHLSLIVIGISLILRVIPGFLLELGNDEVYYWLYVKYPALSYFDHPAGASVLMSILTLDLIFDSELALRLASIIPVTINGFIVFKMLKWMSNSKVGFYGVILYYSSFYVSIISGIFILPDGPLSSLWLLSIYYFLRWDETQRPIYILLTGLLIGLAITTKYHAIFLWFGIGLYTLLYKRIYLTNKYLYFSVFLSIVGILPIVIWNQNNDWQSFTFHSDRVGVALQIRFDLFLKELFGQIIYNNPILVALGAISLWNLRKLNIGKNQKRILILFSVPLILTFLLAALFKPTLPHWSAPGYYPIILISAVFLGSLSHLNAKKWLFTGAGLTMIFIPLAMIFILKGMPFQKENPIEIKTLGKNDFTLDLYGWRQAAEEFSKILDTTKHQTNKVIGTKWFNAAHTDFYICQPNNLTLIALGDIIDIHEYRRINQLRGGIKKGEDAYFFAVSRHFEDPEILYAHAFEKIQLIATIPIKRSGKTVEYFFVYHLKAYQRDDYNYQ